MAWGITEGVKNTGWKDPDQSTWQSGGWYTNPATQLVTQWWADSPSGGGGSDLEAQHNANQAEIERMQRQDNVRNQTDSYLSGRKGESSGILDKMSFEKNKIYSDLQGIYDAIDQAVGEKNTDLVSQLQDEANNAKFMLDKHDARYRQEIGKIDDTNYNNARALGRTDTSLLSNLMGESGGETTDFLNMLTGSRKDRNQMIADRELAIGEDITNRMANLRESQQAAQSSITDLLNPVTQKQQMFAASPMSQYMASKDDFNPNKSSIDNAYNQIVNLLNTQLGKANQVSSQFGNDNTVESILEDLTALTDEGRNQLYDTTELDKALAAIKPTEFKEAEKYQRMVNQLAMQRQPNQRKREANLQNLASMIKV